MFTCSEILEKEEEHHQFSFLWPLLIEGKGYEAWQSKKQREMLRFVFKVLDRAQSCFAFIRFE